MAGSKPAKTEAKEKKGKKEKIFHPESRKAEQLARVQLRKGKLSGQASNRSKKHSSQADVFGFFFHALPPEGVMSLQDLHSLIHDVWLSRHDAELEEERETRRKGRPKSTKEQKLEEVRLRETELYKSGMEVLDLTHEQNVALFRRWDQKEITYPQMLRFIRITSAAPETTTVSRPGQHPFLKEAKTSTAEDQEIDTDVAPPLLWHEPQRFSSTIMAMDGPL
ncbi:hypothetical protein EVG20_g3902 [Dentipellis fragilis]|uniref:Translation machinery-associated protein 16 n=1 Tax=Dentipellis fragilis TaxID=205917 RepID=A0A4Y9YYW7_9AGAM|nr:hypothetical protein EVG20_g3902 [Dentipellis fragilis]